jgi:hypothetical protein
VYPLTILPFQIDSPKGLLQAKGVQSTWDRLGNISAAVDVLKKLKKQVASAMKTAYQGSTHKVPKTDHLVWRVAKKVHEEELHLYAEDRTGNAKAKIVPDVISVGEAKLLSASLNTFNRKVHAMVEGRIYDEEVDTLPQNTLAVNSLTEDSDEHGQDAVE